MQGGVPSGIFVTLFGEIVDKVSGQSQEIAESRCSPLQVRESFKLDGESETCSIRIPPGATPVTTATDSEDGLLNHRRGRARPAELPPVAAPACRAAANRSGGPAAEAATEPRRRRDLAPTRAARAFGQPQWARPFLLPPRAGSGGRIMARPRRSSAAAAGYPRACQPAVLPNRERLGTIAMCLRVCEASIATAASCGELWCGVAFGGCFADLRRDECGAPWRHSSSSGVQF